MKFVIFHGAYGNKNGNWFPYLKSNLIKLRQTVILEQFPVDDWNQVLKTGIKFKPKYQSLKTWLQTFTIKILPRLKKNDKLCFVGHSLAPVFILHLVEKFNLTLDSAIFVEPFLEMLNIEEAWMFDVVNKSFYKTDFNFNILKKYIPSSFVLYSDNDQYVPKKLPLNFANKMGSKKILVKNGQHLGANLPQFPLLLKLCKSRLTML